MYSAVRFLENGIKKGCKVQKLVVMSEEILKETNFEDQFRYYIHKGDSVISSKHSYSLDLLGFQGDVPMLLNDIERPVIAEEVIESVEILPEGVCLEPDKNTVHDLELQATTVAESKVLEKPPEISCVSKPPEIICASKPPANITKSVLQGKKVIIRTNSMSGAKSLIFKQKTGGKVEIPAKLSSLLNSTPKPQKDGSIEPVEQVRPSNVAHVVFPEKNLPKPIIKSQNLIVNSAVIHQDLDVKMEEQDIFTEAEEVVVESPAPFDHDYFNLPSGEGTIPVDNGPPPLVKISSKPFPTDNREENEVKRNVFVKVNQLVPMQIVTGSNETNQYSELSFDQFQAQQTNRSDEPQTSVINKPETKILETQLTKPLDKIDVKKHPIGNYELVNTNLIKKVTPDLAPKKSTYIVMIANKQLVDKTKLIQATPKIVKPKPPKITSKTHTKPYRPDRPPVQIQPTPKKREYKNVETNTDDDLLDELIERKMRERSLQNKVSKTTNTDDLLPFRHNLEDRISITPSPLLLGCDDILDMLEGPIPTENSNGSCMPQNGKAIENCSNFVDISYSRGKNITNWNPRWTPTEYPSQPPTNGWMNNLGGQNGRPRVEPWKVHLFMDLKNCDQFDSSGNMPLHNAVIQNNVNLVKRQCLALQTRQININTLNHNTYTALQLALLHDVNVNIVRLLLQYGSDTAVLDPQGNNVLHICVTHASEAVTKLLLGSTVCADINGTNFEGYTPLIMCTLYQKYVQADDLLCTGADPNISDKKSGRTPLFHAVEANDVEMVKLLLNHRALTKVKNFFGTSPHDAMFELDTISVEIKNLILNKDENFRINSNTQQPKGRKRKKGEPGNTYMIKPFVGKFAKIKNATSS